LLLALAAVAALGASAAGGFFAASRRKPDPGEKGSKDEDGGEGRGARKAPAAKKKPAKDLFEGLPLSLGDVVVVDHEERWLAGALVAKEGDKAIAAVFFAPEGAKTKMVAAFAQPRREILWLAQSRADSPPEPPASIEIGGVAMTRRGRLPVVLSRHGQGVPAVGETGVLAEYEGGADEVAVVVTSEGRALAWSGRKIEEAQYDRLGSGGED
jgi:hypothetical protein